MAMNRQGVAQQSLRGMPSGFGGQQQPQQSGRAVSNRIPSANGKLGGSSSGWAFGGGVPMGNAAMGQPSRQHGGGNVSFAQSLTGASQPATPIDLSEFPSLSNNQQMSSGSQASMWSSGGSGSRSLGGPVQRNQSTPLSSQQQTHQDDMFAPSSSRLPAQSSFRFGNQSAVPQPSQAQPSSVDDFPPLSKNGNGEIGQERGASLMSSLGFGQAGASSSAMGGRAGSAASAANGLLSAVSANARSSEARAAAGMAAAGPSRAQESRVGGGEDDARRKPAPFREGGVSAVDGVPQMSEDRNTLGAIGNDAPNSKQRAEKDGVVDPLQGMPEIDKWGLKGLRTLMTNYPDSFCVPLSGFPLHAMGLEPHLSSAESIMPQAFSLFDEAPPRPVVDRFRLPECYKVTNVQPIDSKIQSFNEETLFWIFYSCPGDVKQQLAAVELNSRNWRWHKKMQLWLTKDDHVAPHLLGPNQERGTYIVWDILNWRKDRQDFTLNYLDLDTSLSPPPQ